jgi:hypothetical protein
VFLFSGNADAYGVHEYAFSDNGTKEKGKSATKKGSPTTKLYAQHLDGEIGLGVIPINKESNCKFGAIDVDIYENDKLLSRIVRTIHEYSLPIVPFSSKSGGLHLFLFFQDWTSAKAVRYWLRQFSMILMLPDKTEIFPKQERLTSGTGNWINLPYYDTNNTHQFIYKKDFKPMSFTQGLKYATNNVQTSENLKVVFDSLPLSDGPPCLQGIYLAGVTEYRNNYLSSLARYYKTKEADTFADKLRDANQNLKDPLLPSELESTVITSHKKRDYAYMCKEEPIVSICNKTICKSRKFGVGGGEISTVSFEQLTQYVDSVGDTFYHWKISVADEDKLSSELKLETEKEVRDQQLFADLCMKHLKIFWRIISKKAWEDIVERAVLNMNIIKIDVTESMTPTAMFLEYLSEYLESKTHAANKEQLVLNRIYIDYDNKMYLFKPTALEAFLRNEKRFVAFGLQQIRTALTQMGGIFKREYIKELDRYVRICQMPFDAVTAFTKEPEKSETPDIDASEYRKLDV